MIEPKIKYYAYDSTKDAWVLAGPRMGPAEPLVAVTFVQSVPVASNICGVWTIERDWYDLKFGGDNGIS